MKHDHHWMKCHHRLTLVVVLVVCSVVYGLLVVAGATIDHVGQLIYAAILGAILLLINLRRRH